MARGGTHMMARARRHRVAEAIRGGMAVGEVAVLVGLSTRTVVELCRSLKLREGTEAMAKRDEQREERGLTAEQQRLLAQIADGLEFLRDRITRLAATDERLAVLETKRAPQREAVVA